MWALSSQAVKPKRGKWRQKLTPYKFASTKGTLEEHHTYFKMFDVNEDGYVDAQELRLKRPSASQLQISTFFIETDKNEDGKVSFDEYMHAQYASDNISAS